MKPFKQYLTEATRTYSFRIKVIGKPNAKLRSKIKDALAPKKVESITEFKSEPIQKVDPLFPGISAPEVYSLDVVLAYPVAAFEIKKMLGDQVLDPNHVAVVNLEYAYDQAKEEAKMQHEKEKSPLLTSDYDKSDSDVEYGDAYNKGLVKNAATGKVKIPNAPEFHSTNELPQGKLSAMGSTKNKLPVIKSFAR